MASIGGGTTQSSPGGMSKTQSVLGGAMAGASVGAMFGPWGAVVGGVGGALMSM